MAIKNVSYEHAVKDSSVGVKCWEIPQTVPSFRYFAHLSHRSCSTSNKKPHNKVNQKYHQIKKNNC